MLDKQDFYHGVAIIHILDDPRYLGLRKFKHGYVVNESTYLFLKYSTKSRSPWRFTFSHPDISHLGEMAISWKNTIIALVCGGDGVCGIPWNIVSGILGSEAGWLAVRRGFNESYALSGPNGEARHKIKLLQWPGVLFLQDSNNGNLTLSQPQGLIHE